MKNVSKKVLCLLSSAMLLSGATAMTASAVPLEGSKLEPFPDLSSEYGSLFKNQNYTLNKDYFEITRNEKARMEVNVPYHDNLLKKPLQKSYQWYRNGNIIEGATSSVYEATDEGSYYCEITVKSTSLKVSGTVYKDDEEAKLKKELIDAMVGNKMEGVVVSGSFSGGMICEQVSEPEPSVYTTNSATVKIVNGLRVRIASKSGQLNADGKYTLSAEANGGTAPYSYQWINSNGDVVGTKKDTDVYVSGSYYCIVTDDMGRTAKSGTITVKNAAMRIIQQPKDGVICSAKYGYTLNVSVSGGYPAYNYEWYYGNNIVGRNNTLTVYDPGSYYCVIRDGNGDKVTSRTAVVDLNYFYLKQDLPSTKYVYDLNHKESFTVKVTGGTGRYRYIWQIADKNGDNWSTLRDVKRSSTYDTYDIYIYSEDKKYRCKIYCLDADDKGSYYRTTNEMNIKKVSPSYGDTASMGSSRR